MAIRTGIGFSETRNPRAAVATTMEQARQQLGRGRVDFAMAFVTMGHRLSIVLDALRAELGDTPLVGCTAAGVITDVGISQSAHALGVALFQSDTVRFVPCGAGGLSADPTATGMALAEQLAQTVASDRPLGMIALPDGLSLNFDALHRGLYGEGGLPTSVPLLGGGASDNLRMVRTHQFTSDDVFTDGVVGVLIAGDAELDTAVTHGCTPLGTEHIITKVQGNVILEIDGRPAVETIGGYLEMDLLREGWVDALAMVALGFKHDGPATDADDGYALRFIPGIDEERGTVTLSTEISEGTRFWVMHRSIDRMFEGRDAMVHKIRGDLGGATPSILFQFDCVGRGKSFLEVKDRDELITGVQAAAPGCPSFGMFTYGELAPVLGRNLFHSYTSVVATLR